MAEMVATFATLCVVAAALFACIWFMGKLANFFAPPNAQRGTV